MGAAAARWILETSSCPTGPPASKTVIGHNPLNLT